MSAVAYLLVVVRMYATLLINLLVVVALTALMSTKILESFELAASKATGTSAALRPISYFPARAVEPLLA